MENLNEGKKKEGGMAYEAALREIDAQSAVVALEAKIEKLKEMACLLYTSPSPRDRTRSRMPSSA